MPKQPLHKNVDKVSPIIVGPKTFEQRPKLADRHRSYVTDAPQQRAAAVPAPSWTVQPPVPGR